MPTALRVAVGDTVRLTLPFSEVCAQQLKIAGQQKLVRLEPTKVAQILELDGTPISFPVLPAEAGLFCDEDGFYAYDAVPAPTA